MRVTVTFGTLIMGVGLCAARACAPHPRPTTTTSISSEIDTTTAGGAATTTTSQETISATTTTAGPPVITNLVENGGFEDETSDPWVVEGASPAVYRSQFFCAEGSKCLQLPGNFNNFAKVCQRVEVEAGFEYTFKAQVLQNCIKEYGSNTVVCEDNVNTAELSIDGVYDSGNHGIVGYNSYNEFTYTFSYTDPSIDSTDLCITITQNQGLSPTFYLDGVSLTRGQAVPIPDPTE